MLRSSLPLGRFFHVDVRMHLSFPLLLIAAIAYSVAAVGAPGRGIALWCTLLFAVLVREFARTLAAAYIGLRLRALLLLPFGGVMAFSSRETTSVPANGKRDTRWVAVAGPLANFFVALLVLGFSLASDPRVQLLTQPWLSVQHILRSLIWMQVLIGVVSLLPTSALPIRQLLRPSTQPEAAKDAVPGTTKPAGISPAFGIGTLVAVAMVLTGVLVSQLYVLIILGAFLMIYLQVTNLQKQVNTEGDSILVRDVMLTEYALLSSSDTLRNALDHTVHSMQDVFPVVRGDRLVGSISRQTIAEHLITDGDSYLQGTMNRNIYVAQPDDKLADTRRSAAALSTGDFIPVVEGNALVGILTPQSLTRAVQQVKFTRPQQPVQEKRS